MINKTYFYLKQEDNWDYYFTNSSWDRLHFAWQPKYIIESLVNLYWQKEWLDIFNKFLYWLDNIKNVSKFKNRTWAFVLYHKE